MSYRSCSAIVLGLALLASPPRLTAATVGKAFTYQGGLTDGGSPATGPYDFEFRLFDDPAAGVQVGSAVTVDDLTVTDGQFAVKLDFGHVFDGAARWLQIAVRPGGSAGAYTTLSPRQELTAAPYANALSLPVAESVSAAIDAFSITNTAGGGALYASTTGGGVAVKGYTTGSNVAGWFEIDNPASAIPALYGKTNGSDAAIWASSSAAGDALGGYTSGTGRAGYFQIFNPANSSAAVYATTNGTGPAGSFSITNAANTNAVLYATTSGTGPAVHADGALQVGSNPGKSGSVNVVGSARSASLDMSLSGDSSVTFPPDAISSIEILDEPGLASSTSDAPTALDGTTQTLLTRTITCPADGHVLVIGTCQVQISHTNGVLSTAAFGVSPTGGSLPGNQDVDLQLPSNAASGTYHFPVTVHGTFGASAGEETFYLLADENSGNFSVSDMQLSVVYLPTFYGAVASPSGGVAQGVPDEHAPVKPAMTPEDIAAERADSTAFNAARIERELAAMKAEIESLKAQLQERNDR